MTLGTGFLAWLVYRGFRVGDQPQADFFDFYHGALAVRTGDDLYRVNEGGYIYPPFLAVVLRPITFLDPALAANLWTFLLAALLALTACLAARETTDRLALGWSRLDQAALAAAAIILLGGPWKSEFQWGNSNLLLLFPIVLALRWLGRRPILCGTALALAASIKYIPIVFLPYLLVRRRYTEAASFVAIFAALLLAPAIVLGWEKNLHYLAIAFGGFSRMAQLAPGVEGANIHDIASGFSLSFTSSIARALRDHAMDPHGVPFFAAALAGVLFLTGWAIYAMHRTPLFARRTPRTDDHASWRGVVAIEWSALLTLALLFSPQTTHRHLNLLLPLVLLALALAAASPARVRWSLIAALALLTLGATAIPGLPGWRAPTERWNESGGAALCVTILLFTTLWATLRRHRAASNSPAAPPHRRHAHP